MGFWYQWEVCSKKVLGFCAEEGFINEIIYFSDDEKMKELEAKGFNLSVDR